MPRKSATWETALLPRQGRHAVDFFSQSRNYPPSKGPKIHQCVDESPQQVPVQKEINSRPKTFQLRYMPVRVFIYIFFCLYFDLSHVLVAVFSPLTGLSPRGTSVLYTQQDSTCALTERAVACCSAPGLNSRGAESNADCCAG